MGAGGQVNITVCHINLYYIVVYAVCNCTEKGVVPDVIDTESPPCMFLDFMSRHKGG